MKTRLIVAVFAALSASIAAPAFASGYGPAPFYKPSIGAPASQRGQRAQTVAADRNDATTADSYGGAIAGQSESARHGVATQQNGLYERH
ncbi:hypothetical protein [Paraburkholderia saeva]|uniref:DUF4148 domain-containing protein n=1 Tax=Paraburkholderia saeva TaxID=2777537 RepID=A0A9N8X413_9BURK|nr:hypothetical protein [Paraburkholderia saeva]CAG4921914.1 hypothetical protein R70241_05009 [Paraburkholderia saeva]CAG4925772.1 hypothetical protein LMG31841_05520 [Paraburkholderia saeva]CAG4927458.1 hypothetical protein R52603_05578 [Paraburkholderia saeva]